MVPVAATDGSTSREGMLARHCGGRREASRSSATSFSRVFVL
jgi:hypothetical protein